MIDTEWGGRRRRWECEGRLVVISTGYSLLRKLKNHNLSWDPFHPRYMYTYHRQPNRPHKRTSNSATCSIAQGRMATYSSSLQVNTIYPNSTYSSDCSSHASLLT